MTKHTGIEQVSQYGKRFKKRVARERLIRSALALMDAEFVLALSRTSATAAAIDRIRKSDRRYRLVQVRRDGDCTRVTRHDVALPFHLAQPFVDKAAENPHRWGRVWMQEINREQLATVASE